MAIQKAAKSKCNACENNSLEFSPFLKAWVFSCNKARCAYEPKKSDGLKITPRDRKREKEVLETRG